MNVPTSVMIIKVALIRGYITLVYKAHVLLDLRHMSLYVEFELQFDSLEYLCFVSKHSVKQTPNIFNLFATRSEIVSKYKQHCLRSYEVVSNWFSKKINKNIVFASFTPDCLSGKTRILLFFKS
jgi:hypothetical protein